MKTDDINYLINRLKSGQITTDEYQSLVKIIIAQLKYTKLSLDPKSDAINDIISETIKRLYEAIVISKIDIKNPIGYIITILNNLSLREEIAYTEISQLRNHLKNILNKLKIEGKINSYNNRKYCINGFQNSNYNKVDVLNLIASYDFSEINREVRWTKTKIELLSDFVMKLLEEIKCVDFSTIMEFIKIKMELKVINIRYDTESSFNDEDTSDINTIDQLTFDQNSNYDEQLLSEISDAYERSLTKFIQNDLENNIKILRIIYYHEYENKTLNEIAEIFNYSSPTTIQNILRKNLFLTPVEFVKAYSLLDEKISNQFEFLDKLNDSLLAKLEKVVGEFNDD